MVTSSDTFLDLIKVFRQTKVEKFLNQDKNKQVLQQEHGSVTSNLLGNNDISIDQWTDKPTDMRAHKEVTLPMIFKKSGIAKNLFKLNT